MYFYHPGHHFILVIALFWLKVKVSRSVTAAHLFCQNVHLAWRILHFLRHKPNNKKVKSISRRRRLASRCNASPKGFPSLWIFTARVASISYIYSVGARARLYLVPPLFTSLPSGTPPSASALPHSGNVTRPPQPAQPPHPRRLPKLGNEYSRTFAIHSSVLRVADAWLNVI